MAVRNATGTSICLRTKQGHALLSGKMEMFAAILVSMPKKTLEVSVLFARELSFVALTIAYAYLFCLNYFIRFVYVIYYSLYVFTF